MGDLFAEIFAYGIEIDECVLDDVMEQAGGHRHFVESHIGEDVCDLERVNQVRLTRGAFLTLVLSGREQISAPQQIEVRLRVITRHILDNFFDADHLCEVRSCFELRSTSGNLEYNKKVMPNPKVEHHQHRKQHRTAYFFWGEAAFLASSSSFFF